MTSEATQRDLPTTSGSRSFPMLLTGVAVMLLCACAAPIGVKPVSPRAAQQDLTRSVLTAGGLSEKARILLRRTNQEATWQQDPARVLAYLHAGVSRAMSEFDAELRATVMDSVAELAFAHADRSGDRRYYLAAALYAWLHLFPGENEPRPAPLDRGVRLSADIYNRGLALALMDPESGELVLEDREHELPFGTLEIDFDENGLRLGNRELSHFISLADLRVTGLNNRYRRSGLGAPVAGRLAPPTDDLDPDPIYSELRVPLTALLHFEDLETALAQTRVSAKLSLISFSRDGNITIDGRSVPLEVEPSAALALQLTENPPWQRELKGFFQGDLALENAGLVSLSPYRPGRIPVVLVHGTASSAGRWADMVNDLNSDPVLRRHYQILLFTYNTGNPILYSGWLLRSAISDFVEGLDPEGRNPALRDIVVMGHSQGGLLTKLLAVNSGDQFWRLVIDEPPDQVELAPGSRKLLEGSLIVAPSPFVKRVIFLSTPHRGSRLANRGLARLFGRAVRSPANLVTAAVDLFADDPEAEAQRRLERGAGSIGNMSPGSTFIQTLAPLPIAPSIHAHSIIGVQKGAKEEGSDGVVSYQSAHLDDVESELVVQSGHSSQANPLVVRETRRILLVHLTEAIERGILEIASAPN